jgi:RHS repeat-associated protein
VRGTDTHYYHYNGIGTVTNLTDNGGNLIQSYIYDAFGNILQVDSYLKGKQTVTNPYRFSTKEYNSRSGLIYFGARYYDPKIGRFITPDPWTWGPDDPRLFTPPTSKLVTSLQKDNVIARGGIIDPNIFISSNFLTQDLKRAILEIGSTYPQNYHKYIYTQNNPVNFVDPYGTFIFGTSWKSFLAWLIPTVVGAFWAFGYVTWPVFVVAAVVAVGLYTWDAYDIVEWARPVIDPAERWKENQWNELLYGKPPP